MHWTLNTYDLAVTLHTIHVEILTHYLKQNVVPPDDENPFLYWLRFAFGQSGNPHAHGIAYVPGNPEFDLIVKDAEQLLAYLKQGHPEIGKMRTWQEAEKDVAAFYTPYVNETHPCKDMDNPRVPARTLERAHPQHRASPTTLGMHRYRGIPWH